MQIRRLHQNLRLNLSWQLITYYFIPSFANSPIYHIILLYKKKYLPWIFSSSILNIEYLLMQERRRMHEYSCKYLISISFAQLMFYIIFFLPYSLSLIPFPSTLFCLIFHPTLSLTSTVDTIEYTEIKSGLRSTVFWVTQSLSIFKRWRSMYQRIWNLSHV